jgi:myo-inositol 2-dehydrogenase/D-chiro-inositol 1-dehydrogenase
MALRVGIVGAGHMGQLHAEVLSADERVRVTGVTDLLTQKSDALAEKLGAESYLSMEDLLASGIQAVYVTTPNTTHAQPTLQALSRGTHVFCEKPFATSMEEADAIIKTCERAGVVYQGGHNRRYAPAYRFLKQKIEDGFTPFLVTIKMNDGDLKDPPWLSDRKATGGFLYETTIHLLDIAVWLMGDAVEIRALAKANLYPDLVDWAILFSFRDGRMGTLTSSGHASWHGPTERVEIVGDHALLVSEGLDSALYSDGRGEPVVSFSYAQLPPQEKWGYVQEDRAFVDAVLSHGEVGFSARDGWRIVRLIEACYQSAETGKSVLLK